MTLTDSGTSLRRMLTSIGHHTIQPLDALHLLQSSLQRRQRCTASPEVIAAAAAAPQVEAEVELVVPMQCLALSQEKTRNVGEPSGNLALRWPGDRPDALVANGIRLIGPAFYYAKYVRTRLNPQRPRGWAGHCLKMKCGGSGSATRPGDCLAGLPAIHARGAAPTFGAIGVKCSRAPAGRSRVFSQKLNIARGILAGMASCANGQVAPALPRRG